MTYIINSFRFVQDIETIYVYAGFGTNRLAVSTNVQDFDDYDIGATVIRGAVYSEELDLFVIVGGTTTSSILTSTDGINYTSQSPPNIGELQDVCWSPNLNLFAAVSATGGILTSPNGTTWTSRTSGTSDVLGGIAWSESLGLFLAGGGGANNFRTTRSSNGTSWTAANDTGRKRARKVFWFEDEAIFLTTHQSDSTRQASIVSSTNGTSFTTRLSINASGNMRGITYSPDLSLFVAVSNDLTNRVYTSTNGTSWTARTPATTQPWINVVWSEKYNLFLAVSLTSSSAAQAFMTSSNGTSWTSLAAPNNISWGPIIVKRN